MFEVVSFTFAYCLVFQAVAYFISVLDKIVNRDYVIVYLHTLSSEENQPPLSFLKDIYHLVDNKLVFLTFDVTELNLTLLRAGGRLVSFKLFLICQHGRLAFIQGIGQ